MTSRRGGRPGCPESVHFIALRELEKAKGGYTYHECRFCRAAYDNDVTTALPRAIMGRARNFRTHLAECINYKATQLRPLSPVSAGTDASPPETPSAMQQPTPESIASRTRSQSINRSATVQLRTTQGARARRSLLLDKRSTSTKRHSPLKKKYRRQFTQRERKVIEFSLIEMHADNHLPDRFIEQESVLRFLDIVSPGLRDVLPSRRVLGGRVLKEHATRCAEKDTETLRALQEETGGRINILSDVWKNISKEHLLGVQLTLFGVVLTYSLEPCDDRHDGLSTAEDLETIIKRAIKDGWSIGACVTDNAGQCGRARRILAIRWPNIVFIICFAHDVNNLVRSVLKTAFPIVAGQAADAVKCLNASSSKWLKRANNLMKKFYGRSLGLRTLCETRWNSMQGCFASLLRVQSALEMLYRQYASDVDFPLDLHVLGDPKFWSDLKIAEAVISPLSYASYRLQRDENTVGDVVLSYRDIFKGFSRHGDELVKCVEERWRECEQPLFMLGFALHPTYADEARTLPNTSISGVGTLPAIAVYYY